MAHSNIFNYGLGFYGSGCGSGCGDLGRSCSTDQYGHCSSIGGPQFLGLTYKNATRSALMPMTNQQKMQFLAMRNAPNAMAGLATTSQNPVEEPVPKNGIGVW